MDKYKIEEIRRFVQPLTATIERTKQELSFFEFALEAKQAECDHADGNEEEYRQRRTGMCSICLEKFLTKEQIDAIFSD